MNTLSKNDSCQLIRNCLGIPYKEDKFRLLVANIFPNSNFINENEIQGNNLPNVFKEHIISYKKIIKYCNQSENIDVLAVKIKSLSSMIKARTMQRQFIGRYLNGSFDGIVKDAALVAFYCDDKSDWRLSLVYKEYSFGNYGIKVTLTEPRRCSFLVGTNELTHTAEQQLVNLLQLPDRYTINRLKEAFSVERVTNEFFLEYKNLFQDLTKIVETSLKNSKNTKYEFERCKITPTVYAKRLLGQIVFLYFLQKKGWLGVDNTKRWGEGSHSFLQDLFNNYSYKNFFSDILNPLFYEALAVDRKNNNYCFKLLNCRIPFLNGGLFEPIGDHDWHKVDINISNDFFKGLFQVFERYNFTVREDEPLEQEVAVDPEMLGKIFESLLDVDERRAQGTFYTPRWIVHYMCRESLIHYLDRAINYTEECSPCSCEVRHEVVPLKDIKHFIRYDENKENSETNNKLKNKNLFIEYTQDLPESIELYAKKIDEALANVKVCDPAIGSGAFAVGMMLEIIHARQSLHQAKPELFKEIYGEVPTTYILKRDTIRNSLYGVDQEASAVDIAKLRLWLSLVVDEEDFYQIKPLPNLDYKIMVGDSITYWKESNTLNFVYAKALQDLQNQYFSEINHDKKLKLKKEIESKRTEIDIVGNFDWNIDFPSIMSSEKSKRGFDIIIGNPPYIQIQKLNNTIKNNLKDKYSTYAGTGDIYCIFYELSFKIAKQYGIISFITSNKWMKADYGNALRKFFSEKSKVIKLIDFAGNKVFDSATVDVNIIVLENIVEKQQTSTEACVIKDDCSANLSDYFEHNHVTTRFEVGQSWAVLTPIEQSIKEKIEAVGKPLKDWDVAINYGIKTGLNEAFVISGEKKDELILADPKSAEIIRPILRGKDIKRFGYDFHDLWLINTHNGCREQKISPIDINKYPVIKAYLDKFYQKLATRQDRGITPYNLRSCAYLDNFSKHKITWGNLCLTPQYAFVEEEFYINAPAPMIVPGDKYLLSVLNSVISDFYIRTLGVSRNGGYFEYKPMFVEKIPIPIVTDDIKNYIINNVNLILKQKCENTKDLENKIDKILFKICNLNDNEIRFLSQKTYNHQ